MPTTSQLTTLEWAKLYGVEFRVRIQLDNHEPPREFTSLTGYRYQVAKELGSHDAIVLVVGDELRDFANVLYLIDNNHGVEAFYVAGYAGPLGTGARGQDPQTVVLHPFPRSEGVRKDNGRPVDMSGWQLGPRRAYHCKVVG